MGWRLANKKIGLVVRFIERCRHAVHRRKRENRAGCCFCTINPSIGIKRITLNLILQAASQEAEKEIGRPKMEREYEYSNGLWFSSRRMDKEGEVELMDVDAVPFFDKLAMRKMVPVVLVSSAVFETYQAYVHDHLLDHPGVETTLREVNR